MPGGVPGRGGAGYRRAEVTSVTSPHYAQHEATFRELMRTLIEELNEYRGLLRPGRNVRITLHVTGTRLAKTEVSVFSEVSSE